MGFDYTPRLVSQFARCSGGWAHRVSARCANGYVLDLALKRLAIRRTCQGSNDLLSASSSASRIVSMEWASSPSGLFAGLMGAITVSWWA